MHWLSERILTSTASSVTCTQMDVLLGTCIQWLPYQRAKPSLLCSTTHLFLTKSELWRGIHRGWMELRVFLFMLDYWIRQDILCLVYQFVNPAILSEILTANREMNLMSRCDKNFSTTHKECFQCFAAPLRKATQCNFIRYLISRRVIGLK